MVTLKLIFSPSWHNSPLVGLGLLLIHEGFCGFYITHGGASESVGLLWTSDQLVAETSISQQTDIHAPPSVGFEPMISTGKWP